MGCIPTFYRQATGSTAPDKVGFRPIASAQDPDENNVFE
jgi:hypothetical protein